MMAQQALNATVVADSYDSLADISDKLEKLTSTSNTIFVMMAICIFVTLSLLLVQVAFSIFTLKQKPPPQKQQMTNVVIKNKPRSQKSTTSRSKRNSTGPKKGEKGGQKRNYPSKEPIVMVDFDRQLQLPAPRPASPTTETMAPRPPPICLPGYKSSTSKMTTTSSESLNRTPSVEPTQQQTTTATVPPMTSPLPVEPTQQTITPKRPAEPMTPLPPTAATPVVTAAMTPSETKTAVEPLPKKL